MNPNQPSHGSISEAAFGAWGMPWPRKPLSKAKSAKTGKAVGKMKTAMRKKRG